MLKVIIIDNELEAIRTLKTQLEKYCSHLVSVVAFCQDSEEAIPLILELHADLIFLETEMSPFDGFELLDRVKDIPFEVIFITNFDEHA
ncbi:MAG: LytR/AlgR family response regulator transcription factor, partial [Saprospiraceae bacterium]